MFRLITPCNRTLPIALGGLLAHLTRLRSVLQHQLVPMHLTPPFLREGQRNVVIAPANMIHLECFVTDGERTTNLPLLAIPAFRALALRVLIEHP